MKKKIVIPAVACCAAAVLLLCFATVGFATGGFGLAALRREDLGKELSSGYYSYQYTWDLEDAGVDSLEIRWVNGAVRLVPYDGAAVRVTEKAERELAGTEKLSLSQSGGALRVRWDRSLLRLPFFQSLRKDLTVEVPRALARQLENLYCENVSGDVRADGFTAAETHLISVSGGVQAEEMRGGSGVFQSTSGNVDLYGGRFEDRLDVNSTSGRVRAAASTDMLAVESVSGGVEFSGSARELNAHTVSGSLKLTFAACPEQGYLDSVSGSITLALPEEAGFTVTYDSVSGSFFTDLPLQGGGEKEGVAVNGDGAARFEMETTSGALRVVRAQES